MDGRAENNKVEVTRTMPIRPSDERASRLLQKIENEGKFEPEDLAQFLTEYITLSGHTLNWEQQIQGRVDEISGDLAELSQEFDRNIEIVRRGFGVIAQMHELDLVADRKKRKPRRRTRRT